jgi:ABC-type uncharacterized transport system ATPase subunit
MNTNEQKICIEFERLCNEIMVLKTQNRILRGKLLEVKPSIHHTIHSGKIQVVA